MARNTSDTEWQSLNVLICNRCKLKTSDAALLQAHHCKPRNQQITAGVSYNLVNAKFTCSLCIVELPETEFCEHLEGHLTLKPYVCKYCSRDFPTRDASCEHLISFHQQHEHTFVLKLSGRTKEIIQKARNHGKEFYKPVNVLVPISNSAEVVIRKTTNKNLTPVPEPKQKRFKSPVSRSKTVRTTAPKTISPMSSYSILIGLGSTTVRNTVPTTISPMSSYSPLSGLGSTTVRNTVPTTISPVSSYSPLSGLGSTTVRNTVFKTISPMSSYSPVSGLGSTTVRNTVPTTISSVSSYSPHSSLGSTTVRNTVPTTISPMSLGLGAHPHVVSQLNSNTVLASSRPQLPAEQRRMFVVLTTQPQTGSLPTLSTNALQTQAPSCLSQNVCAPASATSWRHPFAQKLPGQIIVPYVNNVPMLLQGVQTQRGGIQKPATTLPNLVTHSLHLTAPSITQNISTRGVHIVTNVSPASANQVNNAPALTVPPVFHLNQSYLSAPSVQNAPGTQMAATLTSNLVNNISASSAVTPKTHKAGNHLVPTVSPSHVNQPLAPAVIASTKGNRPLMSADVPVNCQSPTESNAGNIYKVSIQQFPTEVNPHDSFTITPLSAGETAVTSSVTQTERLPESRRKSHDNVTFTPLSATETVAVNPRTRTERLSTGSIGMDLDQLELHLQESLLKVYSIKRKLLCYELNMHRHSNVPQQASQEDIPFLSNAERDAETAVQDYQCEDTHHESYAMSGATANVLDETEIDASKVIDNSKVCSKDVELPETHSHHELRNVADGITAQTTQNISAIPKLLDLVKTSKAMKRLISAVSLNTGKASNGHGAVANTEPNCIERRRNSLAQEHCKSGRCTTTVNERRGNVDVDLHGLMRPVSSHGINELTAIVSDVTVVKASKGGNDGLVQIENSGNKEEYVQPVLNTSTSIDSRNSVKSALSRDEDNLTNTELDYEDQCCQEVVAEIPLGVQSSSHGNFGRTVSENISTSSYSITVPLNDHCLNEKSESGVVGQAEAIGEISKCRVKHDASSSAVGNTDASSDLDQATSVESQDGCDVTSDSSSDKVSCKLPQTSDSSVGSKDYFNITSTAVSLPVTRVSDFASISAANFNLEMAETRTILCISEQNKLEYTANTCLPVQDIGADIENRQESRHSSVVLENNLRSGVQHDIAHGISNVVKDGEDQAPSVAVNGKSISRTVFLSSHTSTVGGNNNQEHRQTELLPSCHIHQAGKAARIDSFVSVPSVADEPILNLPLVNRQKPTESLVFQQTVKGASVINHNFESAHDSETNINDLLKEPCINNRSHCTPDVSSVLKTVSHGSDDIPNPATNSLGPDHDTCHDIDFSSSNDPACTLQESVDDFVGNVETLENDISCEHDILHHKTSSNLMQVIQAEKQETKKGGSCDEIHYNKNSLVSTKGGQLYASNETSACIENAESRAKEDRDIFDSRYKRKPDAEPDEGIITPKLLRTNSEKHNTPEDTGKQLHRSVAVSRSPKDIQEADVTAQVCRVNPDSSHKMVKKRKIEMYKCVHCNFTCIWDLEKMNEHISSKHPYYSCEYCEASYDTLKLLYGHFAFLHRGMEPSVMDGTIALDRLFKRVDISCKGQSAECKDITPQTSAKRKKRSPSSLRDGATKRKPKASSNINVIETKRHTHLKIISPVSEHEVRSAEKPTVTSKTAAISNNANRSNPPTPSSYFCNVCNDVKSSELQFRLHLASHPCFKHTTPFPICHRCGYIAMSSSDLAQHTGEHISERRFKCFMCEHDSHNKKSMRAHIKNAHNKTVDDDGGIIDRDKQRNVDLRPRLVDIDPKVILHDPFRQQPNAELVLAYGIKTLAFIDNNCPDILTSEQDVYRKYFAIE